jgi:hypothetical protein
VSIVNDIETEATVERRQFAVVERVPRITVSLDFKPDGEAVLVGMSHSFRHNSFGFALTAALGI